MHRILADSFTDPFKDMEEDYAAVDIEKIKLLSGDIDIDDDEEEEEDEQTIEDINKDKKDNTKQKNDCVYNRQKRTYIPGLKKQSSNYPRMSRLNETQHAVYLRALLRLLSSEKKPITKEEKQELEMYMVNSHIHSKFLYPFLEIYQDFNIFLIIIRLKMV